MQFLTSTLLVASTFLTSISALPQASPVPTAPPFTLEGYAKTNPTAAVSGGAGGATTTVSASSALQSAVKGTTPLVIVVKGVITLSGRLNVGSNKSIIGASSGGNITKYGIQISGQINVIIRNLYINGVTGNDCIIITKSKRIWIDHNEFYSSTNLVANGPDKYDGQLDIIHASDWITVSWNYFHDHWKSSLVGNSDSNRAEDFGTLHVTYHHNYWRNEGTRGNAGRFGFQHLYNNYYFDFRYQAIHSRSDNQVLVEGNVFRGNTREALSTYGLVIPEDSPNTSPLGDYELDGFANLGSPNDFGTAGVNITRTGTFTSVPYTYNLTPLSSVASVVQAYAGVGKVSV